MKIQHNLPKPTTIGKHDQGSATVVEAETGGSEEVGGREDKKGGGGRKIKGRKGC